MFPTKNQIDQDLFLAFDAGGHAVRILVFDSSGRCVAQTESAIQTMHPVSGFVEHSGEELLAGLAHCLQELNEKLNTQQLSCIKSAGLAVQRSSLALWSIQNFKRDVQVISWQDVRGKSYLDTLSVDAKTWIQQETGLPVSAHYGASKMNWLLKHNPTLHKKLKEKSWILAPLASYLMYGLLQERPLFADPVNASRTQLWSLKNQDWSKELQKSFGLESFSFLQSVPSKYSFGSLKLGVKEIPLRICTGDQSASLFANGTPSEGQVTVNLGTGAFLQMCTGTSRKKAKGLLQSVLYSDSKQTLYSLEGTVNGAGSALNWAFEKFGVNSADAFSKLDLWMKQDEIPLFLNGISGLAAPFWVPNFKSRFIGEGSIHSKIAAVAESILFLLRENLDAMFQSGISKPLSIIVSGGLAQQDAICQQFANLCNVAIHRSAEKEATARGLAFLTANQPITWQKSEIEKSFAPQQNTPIEKRFENWHQELINELALLR